MNGSDALVIGGGVIGLSVAWKLAQRGLAVTVVDPAPGAGASYAAAGMLAPVTEVHYEEQALLALNLESARRYPSFCTELEEASGLPVGYDASGTLAVAAGGDDHAALLELFRFQTALGLPVERLTGRQCRELEPSLAPGIRGGVRVAGDHQVDPRRLVAALAEAARRAGVAFVGRRVETILVTDDRCRGVGLAAGDGGAPEPAPASVVVLAAGAWSSRLVENSGLPPGTVPPIRPVKGQIIRLRHREGPRVLNGTLRGLVAGSSVYLVPRADGEIVIGATMEEQGFDTTVTAGAVHQLLRDAYGLLPGVTELELVECRASSRPCSPDNAPVIGPTGLDGLVAATGHHRNGVLLAPVTADLVAELVTDGRVAALGRPFLPARFSGVAA